MMGAATGIARVRRDNKQMDFIFAAYRKAHPKPTEYLDSLDDDDESEEE
jgi:hypothetical protein